MSPLPPIPPPPWQRLAWPAFRLLALVGVMGLAMVSLAVAYWGASLWSALDETSLAPIENAELGDNTQVLDRNGRPLGEFYRKYRRFVPFDQLPPDLVGAIQATEDRNFWNHSGFDVRGIFRALWVHLTRAPYSQGASTITQQVVRHFLLSPQKTWRRKIQEILLSYKLEQRLEKKRIFEIYANRMYLGNGAYGVGAAAIRHFSRPLEDLNLAELALIAGLFQSPSYLDPSRHPERALNRGARVLDAMVDADLLTTEQKEQANALPIRLKAGTGATRSAPYFLDYVQKLARSRIGELPGRGLRITTTLDSEIQQTVEEAVAQYDFAGLETDGKRIETAVLVLDPRRGEVLAMVGGRDFDVSQFNRAVSGKRSPGSLFKPVVYSYALSHGSTWSDLVYVSPVTVRDYRPRDPGREFVSETTLLRAFYRSMNNPTVDLARRLGVERILAFAKDMGIETELKPEIGTTLGGSAVTMLDLAQVYGTLANEGRRVAPVSIRRIEHRSGETKFQARSTDERTTPVMDSTTAFLLTEGMRQVLLRGTGFDFRGLGAFAVGKTGTSNEGRDAWFAGYTHQHVVLVWMGTDDNQSLGEGASGAKLALPLWAHIVTQLTPPPHPEREVPLNVEMVRIHPLYGNRLPTGGVKAYFRLGQTPGEQSSPLERLADQPYREWFD